MLNFYNAVKTIYGPTNHCVTLLKTADGQTLLKDQNSILLRRAEHFDTLLNQDSDADPTILDELPELPPIHDLSLPPTFQEVLSYHAFLLVVRSWPKCCIRDLLTTSQSQCCQNHSVGLGRTGARSTLSSQPGSFRKSAGSNIRTCLWPLSISRKHLTQCKESYYGISSSGLNVQISLLTSSANSMMG